MDFSFITDSLNSDSYTYVEVSFRLILAAFFGFVLGYDRDSKDKPIDFRAYMIICTTTCLLAIMAVELQEDFAKNSQDFISLDLGKIISGVLTGIGFLGAGAIMKRTDGDDQKQIVGTATGASIWAAGGIGLIIGFGLYGLAFVAFFTLAAILMIGGRFIDKVSATPDQKEIETIEQHKNK